MGVTGELTIRPMRRTEVDMLVDWAAAEGWNPGLNDAEIFWASDAGAFLAAELGGEIIGGGATAAYAGQYGFMGFFIVRPEFRGRGMGNVLWHARRDRLIARLDDAAPIGMDGVFTMQDYYAKGGFVFAHRNLRFALAETPSETPPDGAIVQLADLPFAVVESYDRQCFPAPRAAFLRRWIAQPSGLALGYLCDDALAGYGVVRRCREGCKIGPLFADDAQVAESLFDALVPFGGGGPIYLDVPENQPAAMALVAGKGMSEVFGCARMYLQGQPVYDERRVFGVTTFEFG